MDSSITIHYSGLLPRDADRLIRFFHAIGLTPRGTYPSRTHAALFSAPIAAVAINALANNPGAPILSIGTDNPDVIFDIARKYNFKILRDSAHPETSERSFSIKLPGNIV